MSRNPVALGSSGDRSNMVSSSSVALPLPSFIIDKTRFCFRLVVVVWFDLVQDAIAFASGTECCEAFAAAFPCLVVDILELAVGDVVAHVARL